MVFATFLDADSACIWVFAIELAYQALVARDIGNATTELTIKNVDVNYQTHFGVRGHDLRFPLYPLGEHQDLYAKLARPRLPKARQRPQRPKKQISSYLKGTRPVRIVSRYLASKEEQSFWVKVVE